jgi:hypothetical protein
MTHNERLRELFRLMFDCPACGPFDVEDYETQFASDPYWTDENVRQWLVSHGAESRFFE